MAAVVCGGVVIIMCVIMLLSSSVYADPDMLQDICVANLTSVVRVNGYPCKSTISADDFLSSGIANPGPTNNSNGADVTWADTQQIPGLNTLGISLARIDYAPGGLNPPHTHPRATEMAFVLEGELDVGFITTANVLYAKTIKKGDVFVFPRGLVHYQKNNCNSPAAVISAFNSQLPGTQSIANTLFAASPRLPDNVLANAFQIGTEEVQNIESRLAPQN